MRFILQYPDFHGPDADMMSAGPLPELARAAEQAGWSGLAFTEHPAPSESWLRAGGHQALDPFVALGAAAAVTTTLKLLTYLAVAPYRNPLLLAKSAATVDILSGGRLILGLGTGYLKSEFFAVGADFDQRNADFDEALDVLPLHWSGEPFSYDGRQFSARSVMALPSPPQQPIPIWLGGNSRLTLKRVAAKAQGWMPMMGSAATAATARTPAAPTLAVVRAKLADLAGLAGDRTAELDIALSYSDQSVWSPAAEADRHRQAFAEYQDAGAGWVVVAAPPDSHTRVLEFIESFAAEYING